MTTEPEGPAAHTEKKERKELKDFLGPTQTGNRHISVLRSLTKKIGENYEKCEFKAESDIGPDFKFQDALWNLDAQVEDALNQAFQSAALSTTKTDGTAKVVTQPPVTEIRSTNPYESLPFWKQSVNRKNLRTFRICPETMENSLARELADRVKELKSMKVGSKRYTWSKLDNGMEFCSEWSQTKIN
jgi:hypothetical protein